MQIIAKIFQMMRTLINICIIMSCAANCAHAYMPQIYDPKDILYKGKAVFTGRIVKIEELDIQECRITSLLTLKMIKCYYGVACKNGDYMSMKYISESIVDRELSADFILGSQALFILMNIDTELSNYVFDSHLEGGMDQAYEYAGGYWPKRGFENCNICNVKSIWFPHNKYTIERKALDQLLNKQ